MRSPETGVGVGGGDTTSRGDVARGGGSEETRGGGVRGSVGTSLNGVTDGTSNGRSVSGETTIGGGVSPSGVRKTEVSVGISIVGFSGRVSSSSLGGGVPAVVVPGVDWFSSSASDFRRIGGRRESPSIHSRGKSVNKTRWR